MNTEAGDVPVRTGLTRPEWDRAGEVLAVAFRGDPVWSFVAPPSSGAELPLGPMWRAVIAYAARWGVLDTAAEVGGVACWLPPGQTTVRMFRALRCGMVAATGRLGAEARWRMLPALQFIEAIHKRRMPGRHWYLWAIGVHPDQQGGGIGAALLRAGLARADAGGHPCYLETETEWNVEFYSRHGFAVLESAELPGGGPRVWAMARRPGG